MDTPSHPITGAIETLSSLAPGEMSELAWAAGLLCALGTFTLHEGRPLLIVKSSRDREAVSRFAAIIHANANLCRINGKPGLRVTVSGERLHKVMKMLWPELTRIRKRNYLAIRERAKEWESGSGIEVAA